MVKLTADGYSAPVFGAGERIAQAMVIPVKKVSFTAVSELSDTERGDGGFGSTGAKYTIITRSMPPCAYCERAKALLDSKGIAYTEYDLSANEGSIELFKILGYKTIPVITQW